MPRLFFIFLFLLLRHICLAEFPGPPPVSVWQGAQYIYPGIQHARLRVDNPRLMAINLVRVDLTNPYIRFVATEADPMAGQPMPDCPRFTVRTRRQTTGEFMKYCRRLPNEGGLGLPVLLAVNSCPWSPWESPFTHKFSDNMGLLVSGGRLVCPSNGRPGLVVTWDNKLEFRDFPKDAQMTSDMYIVLCGFQMVMRNDEIVVKPSGKDLHPRTVWGLDKERKILYIMTIDGRQDGYSLGADLYECAQMMKYAGASDAINMDGGGSTTLVYWSPVENQPVLLNQPNKSNYQRTVGASLGIYYAPVRRQRRQ